MMELSLISSHDIFESSGKISTHAFLTLHMESPDNLLNTGMITPLNT